MKMTTLAVIGLLCVTGSMTSAIEVDLQTEIDVKVVSAFVWRGNVLNDEAVIQPSVTLRGGDMSMNVWGSWDLNNKQNSSEHTRMDVMLDYSLEHGDNIFSAGVVAYVYDDDGALTEDTFETFLSYAMNVVSLPSLTVYYDFGELEGIYASVAFGHSIELVQDRAALDLGLAVGGGSGNYNSALYDFPADEENDIAAFTADSASLLDLSLSASASVALGERTVLTPGVKYTTILDSDISDALDSVSKESDEFLYSLMLSLYF